MTPENIGRLIIIVMSGIAAMMFIVALWRTRRYQDVHRLSMWVGFVVLCLGNAMRNLVSGRWLSPLFQMPGMGLQVLGMTCLIIGVSTHLIAWERRERIRNLQRSIDDEIGRH